MPGNAATTSKANILLVQSAQTQGNSTRRYLEHAGYSVLWAGSGISALMVAKDHRVDLILLDFALPDIEGSDLCRRFRSRDQTRNIPIILLTARGSAPEAFSRPPAGPDDYLAKPYTESELDARITSVLRTSAAAKKAKRTAPAPVASSGAQRPAAVAAQQALSVQVLPLAPAAAGQHQPAASSPAAGRAAAQPAPAQARQPLLPAPPAPMKAQPAPALPPRSFPAVAHQEAAKSAPSAQQGPGPATGSAGNRTPIAIPARPEGAPETTDEVTDAATGLFSRRQFMAMFSKEFKRSIRFKQQMSCMLIDLDGRTVGRTADAALVKDIIGLVQRTIREVDTAAVWTGDAFIVLLPNTIRNDAVQAGMRVLEAVAVHPFSWPDATRVTMSIGVAGMPDPAIDTEQKMIEAAQAACDRARTWAKK